jgi:O-antigen/teichoic acid export membrane protein
MKDLLSFGLRSTGGGVTTYVYSLIDNFTVTRWLGTEQLGFYQKSFDFTSRTVDGLNNVLSAVLLPSYAQIQSERDRLSRAYLKSLRLISFIIVPVSLGMLVVAPDMVAAFLKEKWAPMVAPFQVLCLASMVKPLSATTSVLFTSTGHPGYNFRAGIVVILALIPMIILLLPFGIVGVAFAVLTAQAVGFGFNMYQVTKILKGTASRMLVAVAPAVVAAGLMMLTVVAGRVTISEFGGTPARAIWVVVLVCAGGLIYSVSLYLMQRALVKEVLDLALTRFRPNVAKS